MLKLVKCCQSSYHLFGKLALSCSIMYKLTHFSMNLLSDSFSSSARFFKNSLYSLDALKLIKISLIIPLTVLKVLCCKYTI